MLVQANSHLRQEILGFSYFHRRECQLSSKITPTVSCLSANPNALRDTGLFKLHSETNNRNKGFWYTNMSSQIVETKSSNMVIEENLSLSAAYETAMEALSSLITRQKRGDKAAIGGTYTKLDRMLMYVKILGLDEKITDLKIIHVAGTKGKGSTCTFCEAILRESGFKTGLFTSPHLIDVRERFRLNGLDIPKDKFLLYFWDCWNQLKENVTEELPMPPLFQFLTVLAFKIFIYEKVDVAIIEVGLGGTSDSTNVIKEPVVCGITSLGMDHMEALGDTLEKIASHKAGILKPLIPAFTAPQLSEAMDVLKERAQDLKVPLEVAAPLDHSKLEGVKLSLSGDHQFINAGLAVSLCKSWLRSTGNWEKILNNDSMENKLPEAFLRGLSTAHISGRAEIIYDSSVKTHTSLNNAENSTSDLIFYLDGAHSPESIEACARWFSNAVEGDEHHSSSSSSFKVGNMEELLGNGYILNDKEKKLHRISKQILLFNCMEVRDPQILLPRLVNTCASSGTYFSKAIFVPSMSTYNKVISDASAIPLDLPGRDLSWQFSLQKLWENIIHGKGAVLDHISKTDDVVNLPPREFLFEDVSHCRPAENHYACSAVIPSLPSALNWLRECVRENPSVRIQVLVTGSLHLVGDMLRLLRR